MYSKLDIGRDYISSFSGSNEKQIKSKSKSDTRLVTTEYKEIKKPGNYKHKTRAS